MKISGYRILGTLLFFTIIYGLIKLTLLIWNHEDENLRLCYLFYLVLLPLIDHLDEEYPEFFRAFKTIFKYIHTLMKKEYRL